MATVHSSTESVVAAAAFVAFWWLGSRCDESSSGQPLCASPTVMSVLGAKRRRSQRTRGFERINSVRARGVKNRSYHRTLGWSWIESCWRTEHQPKGVWDGNRIPTHARGSKWDSHCRAARNGLPAASQPSANVSTGCHQRNTRGPNRPTNQQELAPQSVVRDGGQDTKPQHSHKASRIRRS